MTSQSPNVHEYAVPDRASVPTSRRGDWTWEMVTQFPRQGDWAEEDYLRREFEGLVEFTDGVLEFIDPLYPPEEGGPPYSQRGEWTWELVTEFPRQGDWTQAGYLALDASCLVELNRGVLEFLEMPDRRHQRIQQWLLRILSSLVAESGDGEVFGAPFPIRLSQGQLREPDICWLSRARSSANQSDPPVGCDLAIEVVSRTEKSRRHDYVTKRREYAESGIPEYWIVDPETETITVLSLPAGTAEYVVSGEYISGQTAVSVLLPGFAVDVSACFAAGRGQGDAIAPPSPH